MLTFAIAVIVLANAWATASWLDEHGLISWGACFRGEHLTGTAVVVILAFLILLSAPGKRQAAPFSKGPPKDNPKKPGRKGGRKYGPKARRSLPEQEPDEIIDVPLPEECDACGGNVQEDHLDHQVQVEIPRRPIIRRFDLHVGTCQQCGRRIQSRHDLQTSNAVGAAASQLGSELQAIIAMMKDKYGLSYGNICGLLEDRFGISVSRGGAAQVVLRVADRAEPIYDGLRVSPCSSVVA